MILGSRSNIRAWYKLNGNADDSSSNGYDGTVSGATLTTDKWGNSNSAYDFGGSGDEITLPAGTVITGGSARQIELIFQADISSNSTVFLMGSGGTGSRYALQCLSNGTVQVTISGNLTASVTSTYTTNTWVSVVVGNTSSAISSVYIDLNGEKLSLTPLNSNTINTGSGSTALFSLDPIGSSATYVGKMQGFKIKEFNETKLQRLTQFRTQNLRKAI